MVQSFPMPLDRGPAGFRNTDPSVWNFAHEFLLDDHQLASFQLGEVTGEVAFAKSGQALQVNKIGGLARSERGENREASRFVHETI
jgi:hypothetical protein